MALREATVTVQFAGGLTTDQDPKQVPATKLVDLQNAVFTKDTTLQKRTGYRALGQQIEAGGATYSGALGLGRRDNELLVYTSAGTYSYRPGSDTMALTGNPVSITSREYPLAKTSTEQSQGDAATNNNVTAVAWVDSRGGIWWSVLEESTKRLLRAPAQLAAVGTEPRVVSVGTGTVHIYYADHSLSRIWVAVVDTFNPTLAVAPAILVSDLSTAAIGYDVCPTNLDVVLGGPTPAAPAAIAWPTSTSSVRVGYVDASGVIGSGGTSLPPAVTHAFAPAATSSMGVAWSSLGVAAVASNPGTSTTSVAVFDPTLTVQLLNSTSVVFAASTPRSHTLAWAGNRLYVLLDDTSGAASERDTRIRAFYYDSLIGPTLLTSPWPLRGLSLASNAFVDNGVAYVWATHDVPFFSIYLLIRIADGAAVARSMPTIAHGTQVNGSGTWRSSVSVDPTDARRWRTPLLYNEQLKALAGQFSETGMRWVTNDFSDANAWQSEQLGAGLYLAGACPLHYDGNRWAEAGFHYAPDGTITGTPAVGTGALTVGVYTYRIWYEETDAQGEVHRGPLSVGTAVTLTGGQNQVTLVGPMYRITSRSRVRVCVARSPVNDTSEFFEVTSRDVTTAGGVNGFILNDPTVDTWSIIDRLGDVSLLSRNPTYTEGGILSNDPAPMAGDVLAVGKGRLFFTDPADPTMLRYTQQIQEGFAVDFAELLKQRLDPAGGAISSIGIMDGAVYPFRETAVFVVGGPGPLANPAVSAETFAFTPGDLVTSDVGCIEPRSIAATPVGIVFKSKKGIRLLGRDRKVIDIGAEVTNFDEQDVTAATLVPKAQRIMFLTSEGSTLMWDYQRNQWSRYTNHAGLDALIVNDLYHYLRIDGRVFQETPNAYRDDNSHISMVLELAWLKMAGYLQGWQRIWYAQFLGAWRSRHTLRVRYRLDYERQWSAPFDLDVNSNYTITPYGDGPYGDGPYGASGSSVYQHRIHIGKPCQAIQFRVEDIEATDDYGASFELSELVLTGGMKGPLFKLGATRSS